MKNAVDAVVDLVMGMTVDYTMSDIRRHAVGVLEEFEDVGLEEAAEIVVFRLAADASLCPDWIFGQSPVDWAFPDGDLDFSGAPRWA